MSSRARLWSVAAAGFAVIGIAAAVFITRHRAPRVVVATAEVTRGPIAREVLGSGTFEPTRTVEVGTQVSGTVASLSADFNSVVHAGQVIAHIDPSSYQSQLESARAALAKAQAEAAQGQTAVRDAETKFSRARALSARDLVTPAALHTVRATMEMARADFVARRAAAAAAKAAVRKAEVDLAHTTIRSPIDGVVVNRAVDVGQTVAAAFQSPVLFTIADLSRMQLLTEINEAEVGGIHADSPVTFQVDDLGPEQVSGAIASVRLQPYAESTATTGLAASTPAAVGTAGTAGSSGGTAPGGASAATTGGSAASTGSRTAAASGGAAEPTGRSTSSTGSNAGTSTWPAVPLLRRLAP